MANQESEQDNRPNERVVYVEREKKKKPFYKRVWFWLLAIPLLFIFIAAAGNGDSDKSDNSNKSTDSTASTNGNDKNAEFKVGEAVRVGDVEWTVTNPIEVGTTLEPVVTYSEPKTAQGGGKFIKVTYKVENIGKEMKTTTGADLQDDQGRKFKSFDEQYSYVPEDRRLDILSNLNPNVSQEFDLIYEVPSDAKNFKARVGNLNMFSNEVKLVNLGI